MNVLGVTLDGKDFLKLCTLLFSVMTLYFNLRQDINELRIINNADKVVFNYRLSTIEDLLKINKPAMGVATIPSQPERKNEDE